MLNTTSDDETAITIPRGNVQITPTPIVAALFQRRMYVVGAVGEVPQVNAPVQVLAASAGSSACGVVVVPGVTPIAFGRPKPSDCAVPVAWMIDNSKSRGRSDAAERISADAWLIVRLLER